MTGRSGDGFARITLPRTTPTITLIGDNPYYVAIGTGYNDPWATALDAIDGDLTANITSTSNINPYVVGTYTVTYTVTNSALMTATETRTVYVIDTGQSFSCTQSMQSFYAPQTGKYQLQVWGAQGGSYSTAYEGGRGGYSTGVINLTAGQLLNVYVGCQGGGGATSGGHTAGWNGGGSTTGSGSGGGGATDIRINSTSLYARVIVAGGGGGSSYSSTTLAGYGGGLSGGNTTRRGSATGGTQTAPGTTTPNNSAASYWTPATFGNGGSITGGITTGGGGGGGGWYGGGAGPNDYGSCCDDNDDTAGAGGSGYVFNANTEANYPVGKLLNSSHYLVNSLTGSGNASMPTQTGTTTMTGNSGDGFARITLLDEPTTHSPPTITLIGDNPITINQGSTFVDPGATASDPVFGNLTSSIIVTSNVNTAVVGAYTVTYSVTNGFGLNAAVNRTVIVQTPSVVVDFPCTGAMQTWTAPITAEYTFEAWGAQGGSRSANAPYVGGNGGYSTGKVTLNAGQVLYVYPGCQNSASNTGGFNGGKPSVGTQGSGGGASDIRVGTDSMYARIIVAGGGGGSSQWSSGGVGGGIEGGRASNQASGAATQTTGIGFGSDPSAPTSGSTGGGGGCGWFCGASSAQTPNSNRGGGGGSGWIFTSANDSAGYTSSTYTGGTWLLGSQYYLSSAQTIAGDLSMPAPGGGNETGHAGNGQVRISYTLPAIEEFNYTGAVQTWTVPTTGNYKLEAWGAQGGNGQTGNYNGDYIGGAGGYSVGTVSLTAGENLFIYVGGRGRNAGQTGDGLVSNSFNGGGLSDSQRIFSGWGRSGEGGGASDVRIGTNSLYARVIVAGGGGGAGIYNFGSSSSQAAYKANGGVGGGITGVDGDYNGIAIGGGATQTAGGSNGSGYTTASGFGVGGSMVMTSTSKTSGAGGGGGWYGGGVSSQGGDVHNSGGGGGSGWLWSSTYATNAPGGWLLGTQYYLTGASTIAGNATMPNPTGGTMTGKTGNGYVKITRL